MKAAVAVPPLKDFYFTPHRFSNLGAEALIRVLQNQNIDVEYYNFPVCLDKPRNLKLPSELDYLNRFIMPDETGPVSFFTRYKYYGPDIKECAELILGSKPDIIFLSCFSYCYAEETLLLAGELKKHSDIPVIAGGAGVSVRPEYFLEGGYIDIAAACEAEISVHGIIKDFKNDPVKNRIIRKEKFTEKNEIVFTIVRTHETGKSIFYSTCLSRGCPKKCSFCTNHLSQGRIFRTVPIEKIEEELKKMEIPHHNKKIYINFEDDNIIIDPDYFIKVLNLFNSYFDSAAYLLENGIDYTLLEKKLLKELIKLGLSKINITLASSNPIILKTENRALNIRKYENILKTAEEENIAVLTYFICGFKNDTRESIAETLAYLFSLPTRTGISLFYAVPGLKDFKDLSIFNQPALCAGSSAYPWNNSLSTETLITAFRLSRFINEYKSNNSKFTTLLNRIVMEKALYTMERKRGSYQISAVKNSDTELVRLFFEKSAAAFTGKKS